MAARLPGLSPFVEKLVHLRCAARVAAAASGTTKAATAGRAALSARLFDERQTYLARLRQTS